MILLWLIVVLLVGGLFACAGRALASAAVPLDLALLPSRSTWFWRCDLRCGIWFQVSAGASQWFEQVDWGWIPQFGIHFTWEWMALAFCSFCSRSF